MPLEVATYISQLDENWPTGGDRQDRGDDHIRLIKDVLKNTFAGPSGNGYDKAITVSADLLNNLQTTLDAMNQAIKDSHPIGSLELRADNVNPGSVYPGTTWTLIAGEHSLYLGDGNNGGNTIGNNAPIVPVPKHGHTGTVSIASGGSHTHPIYMGGGSNGPREALSVDASNDEGHSYIGINDSTQSGGAHAHTGTVSISDTGTANATIDVRGSRIFINVWKRVS